MVADEGPPVAEGEPPSNDLCAFTDAHALRGWAEGLVRWAAMLGRDLAAFATYRPSTQAPE